MAKTLKARKRAIRVAPGGLPFLEFVDAGVYTSPAKQMDIIFSNLSSAEKGLLTRSRKMFGGGKKVALDLLDAMRKGHKPVEHLPQEALEVLLECGKEYHGRCFENPIYMAAMKCFQNSATVAKEFPEKYAYVEGVVQPPTGWVVHHAWNQTKTDVNYFAVDLTWARADLMLYFGIAISQELVAELRKASGGYVGGYLDDRVWNTDVKRLLLENCKQST